MRSALSPSCEIDDLLSTVIRATAVVLAELHGSRGQVTAWIGSSASTSTHI
jgi:hypothetical protein